MRYFVYNENNQLIGEYDNNDNVIAEYVYFGLRPVAVKNGSNINIVHTDYLTTPRIVTSGGNIVWQWRNDNPYGNNLAQGTIEFNLRFAGQYYDAESGLHYNIHRTYNPEIGRYMQSDPLGLSAGSNTYNYVGKNPFDGVDPLGLLERDKNGNLVFYPIEPFSAHNDILNADVPGINGYLKTDKGQFIKAFKRTGPNLPGTDYTADCHGWSFANGKYWINNNQVPTILADEYISVNYNEMKEGDKVIYTENREIMHSLTVANVGNHYEAYGKGGNQPRPYLQPIDYGWQSDKGIQVEMYVFRKIK